MKTKNKKFETFLITIFLLVFSIIVNQYYGYIGILPIDSFLVFNSAYDLMNGFFPFKDYWTIKEPFIDLVQAIFFKFLGVSWFSYVLHASIFNCFLAVYTFFIFKKFNQSNFLSLFYSLCVAILTYPTAGTPFSDHHTLILCLISFYTLILALKDKKNFYWFLIPFLLGFAFFTKQAPTVYIVILITVISLIYFIKSKDYLNFISALCGLFTFLLCLTILFYIADIKLIDFYYQYFLYPQSLGGSRFDWLFPFEFKRVVWRYKLFYLSVSVLIFLFFNFVFKKKKIDSQDFLIITGLILFCLLLIMHQLMTINAIFIYCLIPIFCGFSHIFGAKYLYRKKLLASFLVTLTICSSIYYYLSYVHTRTFMDLRGVDISKSINGQLIHPELKNIKWITMFYPNNPVEEAKKIKKAIKILEKDNEKKMIITDYQFISVFLNKYDYAVTRFWYDHHGYPAKNNKYFSYWKTFVMDNINKNKIKNIYVLMPLHGETKPLENILNNCFKKHIYFKNFYKLNLDNC